jgi:hypothetical protein
MLVSLAVMRQPRSFNNLLIYSFLTKSGKANETVMQVVGRS